MHRRRPLPASPRAAPLPSQGPVYEGFGLRRPAPEPPSPLPLSAEEAAAEAKRKEAKSGWWAGMSKEEKAALRRAREKLYSSSASSASSATWRFIPCPKAFENCHNPNRGANRRHPAFRGRTDSHRITRFTNVTAIVLTTEANWHWHCPIDQALRDIFFAYVFDINGARKDILGRRQDMGYDANGVHGYVRMLSGKYSQNTNAHDDYCGEFWGPVTPFDFDDEQTAQREVAELLQSNGFIPEIHSADASE